MKHIEVARKIDLVRATTASDIKKTLLERLERAMTIDRVSGGEEHFEFSGTTGAPASVARFAKVDFRTDIRIEDNSARIIISGYSRVASSMGVFYVIGFVLIMMTALLPSTADKTYNSFAGETLVLLVLGIYIIFDINQKLAEPRELLETALQSLATTYS